MQHKRSHTSDPTGADFFAFIGGYTATVLDAAPTATVKWGLVGDTLAVTLRLGNATKTSVFAVADIAMAAVKGPVVSEARAAALADLETVRRRHAEASP